MASVNNKISSKIIGDSGESMALDFIREKGYRVKAANYRTMFGEIDIIARDGGCLCFIEVKTRYTSGRGTPFEAITPRKMRHLTKAALCYLREFELEDEMCRFDVLGIVADEEGLKIELLKDAFEASM